MQGEIDCDLQGRKINFTNSKTLVGWSVLRPTETRASRCPPSSPPSPRLLPKKIDKKRRKHNKRKKRRKKHQKHQKCQKSTNPKRRRKINKIKKSFFIKKKQKYTSFEKNLKKIENIKERTKIIPARGPQTMHAMLSMLCCLCYAISGVRSMQSTLCYLRHAIYAVPYIYACYYATSAVRQAPVDNACSSALHLCYQGLCYLCKVMQASSIDTWYNKNYVVALAVAVACSIVVFDREHSRDSIDRT